MVNPSIKTKFGYHVCSLETRSGSLANGNNQLRRMTLIVKVGFHLLSVLSFKVRRHSLTHQRRAELHVDHQTVPDLSQFCCEGMSVFIWVFPFRFFWVVKGKGGVELGKLV